MIPLEQYRDHLLQMKPRWVTPMASSVRFDTYVKMAKSRAREVMELPERQDIRWISPTVIPASTEGFIAEVMDEEESFEDYPCSNEPDHVLLAEELQKSDETENHEDTSELEYEARDLSLVWAAPVKYLYI